MFSGTPCTWISEHVVAGLVGILLVDQMEEILDDPLQLLQADRPVVVDIKYPKKHVLYGLLKKFISQFR